ncbi:AzlD domain-containing protein [Alphaproteobacteria bacterium]|nr:AzlD domain-containing protein [Alphaproteobacteria bacterium]
MAGASGKSEVRMIWIVMIIAGLLNFASRFVMLSGLAPAKLPEKLEEALHFVPIAVLSAIIVPSVLIGDTGSVVFADNPRLPAAIMAVVVALITRSVIFTIAAGLATLWLLKWLVY